MNTLKPTVLAVIAVVVMGVMFCCVTELNAQGANGHTAEYPARVFDLPEGGRPVVVRPSFQLLAIHDIDDEAETIEFSGMLTVVWKDSRQAFDPEVEGVDEKLYNGEFQFNEISPAWYPQLVLGNAAGMNDVQGVLLRVKPDGTSILVQMIHSVARSRMSLLKYPFDHQRMEMVFGVLGFDATEVILESGAGAALANLRQIRVPEWDVNGFVASTRPVAASNAGISKQSSVFVLTVELRRKSFFMVRLVILPLMLIVALSWSVFWMDRSSLGDRMSVSFVGILTGVAYQTMVSDIMPQIAYVTFMNAFLSFSFVVMGATAVMNLVVGECDRRGSPQRGDVIDHRCRWMFPLAYAILIAVASTLHWFRP